MAKGDIELSIDANAAGAIKGFRQTENAAEKSAGIVARSARRAEAASSRAARAIGRASKAAALGLAAGAAAAGVALVGMVKGAVEDAAGQARLAKALRNTTGATKSQVAAVEDWISKQGVAYGVADDQLRPALEKLATATGSVAKAQKLATLAMNVSAGTGKSLEQVSTALAKAQNGNVSALARLGISTKDAAGKTISFEEAQKRLAAAHKGQAAKSANTLEGKMRRLKLVLSETGETIGAKLLPFLTRLADWFLNKGLPKIEAFGTYLGTVLPPIFEKVKAVVSAVMGSLQGDVGSKIDGIKQIFTDAVSIVTSLWNAFGDNILSYLRSTLENVKTVLSGAFTVIQGIFQTVAALLKGDWSGVWEGIKKILSGAVKIVIGLVKQLWNAVKFAFSNAGVALKGIFSGLWSGLKTLAGNGIKGIVDLVTGLPGRLLSLGGKMLEAGKGLIGKLWEGIKNVAGNAGGFVSDLLAKIKDGINNLLDLPLSVELPKVLGGKSIQLIPRFERGTNYAPGGWALVGERGPEIVDLPRGSRVTPNEESVRRLADQRAGGLHIDNLTIHAAPGEHIDSSLPRALATIDLLYGTG